MRQTTNLQKINERSKDYSVPSIALFKSAKNGAVQIANLQCEYIKYENEYNVLVVLIDFSLTVKAATLIFISGRGSAISSAKQGKSGSIYNLVKN